jgi:hypothetical protein
MDQNLVRQVGGDDPEAARSDQDRGPLTLAWRLAPRR